MFYSIPNINDNMFWQIGSGKSMAFWHDKWLSKPILEYVNLPTNLGNKLRAKVADFIHQDQWHISWQLQQKSPLLWAKISSIKLPNHECNDKPIWNPSSTGTLTFKDAYESLLPFNVVPQWLKWLWNKTIPPSKTFILWHLIYDRFPIDDLLQKRGMYLTFIYCHFYAAMENINHLLFNCNLA